MAEMIEKAMLEVISGQVTSEQILKAIGSGPAPAPKTEEKTPAAKKEEKKADKKGEEPKKEKKEKKVKAEKE